MRLPFSFAHADLSLAPPLGGTNPYWIEWRVWMSEHYEIPLVLICAYLAMVWLGQKHMSRMARGFNLSLLTVAWNWALSLFSAVGFYHVARAFVASSMAHGVLNPGGVLCRRDVQFDNHWVALFCLSKIPELVDTVLLVLQKKPVIFLHWYHHAVTLMYCWTAWIRVEPNGSLFAMMNLLVHTIMYAYYAMTGMIPRDATKQNDKPLAPSQVNPGAAPAPAANGKTASVGKGKKSSIQKVKALAAVTITPLQILQMVVGSFAIFHTHSVCPDKQGPVFTIFGGVMYVSYLALFIDMFKGKIKTYFMKPAPAKETKAA